MWKIKRTLEDVAYLDVISNLDEYYRKQLESYFEKHGPIIFEAAFIKAYKEVCVKDLGNLECRSIQKKFVKYFKRIADDIGTDRAKEVISTTTECVCNCYSALRLKAIKDLLHKILVNCKLRGYKDRKVHNTFEQITDLATKLNSYDEWYYNVLKLMES